VNSRLAGERYVEETMMPKKNRSRIVDSDGKSIPFSKLPKGSIFLQGEGDEKGAWYSSHDKLPPELKAKIPPALFREMKEHDGGACKIKLDNMVIPIEMPVVDNRSISVLLSEFKRIEKEERQFRGFSEYFWDHIEEQNIGNDEGKAQLYFQECAKLFDLPYTSFFPEFYNAIQSLRKKKALLGAALMKKTYFAEEGEEGKQGERYIVLHLQPKPILPPSSLPRDGENGRWCSQDEYIRYCLDKGEAESEAKMLERLRNDREENKGKMNWAEHLTLDCHRWGTDSLGRVLRKVRSNSPPYYFAYFKEFPMLETTAEKELDDSDNKHELYGDSRNRYEEFKKQKEARFRSQ